MRIDDRVVSQHMPSVQPEAKQVGWFAASQPGVIGFLEEWLSTADAFAVGLSGAWRMCALFEAHDGVRPPRLARAALEAAAETAMSEAQRRMASRLLARQSALCYWLDQWLSDPPVPLYPDEAREVALALAAVLYALDEAAIGRPVPPAR